ncbi:phage tail protein [Sapientia aquatica]|uniref:Phage tail fibre protein N-terminal domain-containing protein n=1 Tax=Sapientia aquatica TaxID=1549640 RepID=A0A4R5W1D0_9BURK|nr:phage tail protein [Sapientia aquatica]TDK65966.1 hypothetical protein E2I14_10250 [Sapientia aquatica]
MAAQFSTILTATGRAKLASAMAVNTPLSLTKMAVGSGEREGYYIPTEDQQQLKTERWRGNINSLQVDRDDPKRLVAELIIPLEVGGFTIREVGLFDEFDALIAVGNFPDSYKPTLQAGSNKQLYVRMVLAVSNTAAVNLLIDSSIALASREYVDQVMFDHLKDPNPHPMYVRQAKGNDIWLNWVGRTGQPPWLFGGLVPGDCGVYDPANFHVSHSDTSTSAESAYHANSATIAESANHATYAWKSDVAEYANTAAYSYASGTIHNGQDYASFKWIDRGDQTIYLWGSDDSSEVRLVKTADLRVSYAKTAESAERSYYAQNANTANIAARITNGTELMAFYWHDPGGQTGYVWGSDDAGSARLSATSNLSVGHARTAKSAESAYWASSSVSSERWNGLPLRFDENPNEVPYYVLGVKAGVFEGTLFTLGDLLRSKEDRFPPGTRIPFAQNWAPTGWFTVQDDSTNNRMLKVVHGGGGDTGGYHDPVVNNVVPAHTHWFRTGHVSNDHTHGIGDPGHSHGVYDPGHDHQFGLPTSSDYYTGYGANYVYTVGPPRQFVNGMTGRKIGSTQTGIGIIGNTTGIWTGGISSNHTHDGATDNGSSQTNWEPRYINLIICQKQ